MKRKYLVALILSMVYIPCANADSDACVQAYAGTLAKYNQMDVVYTGLQTIFSEVCSASSSASSSSLNAGLQTVIYGIPIIASWAQQNNVTNDSSFCSAYKKFAFAYYSNHSHTSAPVVAAQSNFNECEQILRGSQVSIKHEFSPGSVTFSFLFHGTQTPLQIQGLTVESPTQPFSCSVPGTSPLLKLSPTTAYTAKSNFSIVCTRAGQPVGGDVYYGPDIIRIGTSQGASYTVHVDEDTIYGPTNQSAVKAELERLRPYENSTLFITPFHVMSGGDGGPSLTGELWPWDWIANRPQNTWEPQVKQKYCPTALKEEVMLVANPPGNCCGNRQYVMACLTPR
jgi:hypothetical protein